MRIAQEFNPGRLFLLIKKDFYTQYRTFLLALGAMFSILFIVNLSTIATASSWNFNGLFYPLTLFIGGFVFTSSVFGELRQGESRAFYLCIPASSLEKFTSKLLISGFGYALVSLLLFFLFSLIVSGFTALIFGVTHRVFNPFDAHVWLCIRIYLVTQSVFLLGAVYFKENALIKTILSLFVLVIVFVAFILGVNYVFNWIVLYDKQVFFSFNVFRMPRESFNLSALSNLLSFIQYSLAVFFWFLLAPLFWVVSYFRLKELEV